MKMRKILITMMAVLLLTGCGDSTSVDESSVDSTKTDTNQTDTTKTEDEKILKEAEYVGVFGEDVFFNSIGDYVGCEFDIMNDKTNTFYDGNYICCSTYGRPRSKSFHWKYYKQLLAENGLPDIRWHNLRSTYCTLLLKESFNPKAVSKLMGHAKEIVPNVAQFLPDIA